MALRKKGKKRSDLLGLGLPHVRIFRDISVILAPHLGNFGSATDPTDGKTICYFVKKMTIFPLLAPISHRQATICKY